MNIQFLPKLTKYMYVYILGLWEIRTCPCALRMIYREIYK